MGVIHGKSLTTVEVALDGATVSINVLDENAEPASLVIPADCLRALIMTLPDMMRQALCRRYHDSTLRLVYPVADWEIEACGEQPDSVILTLRTANGFHISFVVPEADLQHMGSLKLDGDQKRLRH